MKTQVKRGLCMFLGFFISISILSAQNKENKKETLNGIWNYTLPDAPYEYQEGTIEFKTVGNKMCGVGKTRNSTLQINDILKQKDRYTCSFAVDGYNVNITIKLEKEKITGTVVADNWEMPITMVRKK